MFCNFCSAPVFYSIQQSTASWGKGDSGPDTTIHLKEAAFTTTKLDTERGCFEFCIAINVLQQLIH
jgi:hypothetical protein